MNILQSLPTKEPFCVSLNHGDQIASHKEHARFQYSHPTYHPGRRKAQAKHQNFIRKMEFHFVVLTGAMGSMKTD